MNDIQIGYKVFDSTGAINNGLPTQVTKIDSETITIEYFEGSEGIHKIIETSINVMSKLK